MLSDRMILTVCEAEPSKLFCKFLFLICFSPHFFYSVLYLFTLGFFNTASYIHIVFCHSSYIIYISVLAFYFIYNSLYCYSFNFIINILYIINIAFTFMYLILLSTCLCFPYCECFQLSSYLVTYLIFVFKLNFVT